MTYFDVTTALAALGGLIFVGGAIAITVLAFIDPA